MADRMAELDRVAREIDRARQKQAAHTSACSVVECAECIWLQTELDRLYRRYAHLSLYRERGTH